VPVEKVIVIPAHAAIQRLVAGTGTLDSGACRNDVEDSPGGVFGVAINRTAR
jgi:hypothetical protein